MKATQVFAKKFSADMKIIAKSESTVKALLSVYSRDLLEALHTDMNEANENICDIRFINELLLTLKTTNFKVAVLFFKAYTGFRYDEELKRFTVKEKQSYQAKADAAVEFLNDPLNNIWSWADRNITIEAKPFDLTKVTAQVSSMLKKAAENNINKADVIRAILAGGIAEQELIDVLGFMTQD